MTRARERMYVCSLGLIIEVKFELESSAPFGTTETSQEISFSCFLVVPWVVLPSTQHQPAVLAWQ